MQKIMVLLLLASSFNAEAGYEYVYSCACAERDYECDGINYLTLTVRDNAVLASARDRDNQETSLRFKAEFDPQYKPQTHTDYDRYLMTNKASKEDFAYFLIHKDISEDHWKKGTVKLVQKSNRGGYYTWWFDCLYHQRQNARETKGGKKEE